MNEISNFKTTELANKIGIIENQLYEQYEKHGLIDEAKILKEELNNVRDNNLIHVAFVGQYSAGKSSIISALTGNDKILIHSDVSTNDVAVYSWNGVMITDTPGLYTGNVEHDQKAIDTIRKSDLIVYCITSDLFNPYTSVDFIKWAYHENYLSKMFLVVNQMSKEAGDFDELVKNYTESIKKSLNPYMLTDFSYSFFDVKDYKDGLKFSNPGLIKYSHFEDFIQKLNEFISAKGFLGKFDTPIMIMKNSINQVIENNAVNDTTKCYNSLLTRIENKIDQERNRFLIKAKSIIKNGVKPIVDKGYEWSKLIGDDSFEFREDEVTALIQTCCENINLELEVFSQHSIQALNEEIEKVLSSEEAYYFFKSISDSYKGKIPFLPSRGFKEKKAQYESIVKIAEKITGGIVDFAVKDGVKVVKGFLKNADVAGGKMHQVILKIGQKIGHKFKPWEAVKLAKIIGNIAKGIGVALGGLGIALDIKEIYDDNKNLEEIKKAKTNCRQEFIKYAAELENQYLIEIDNAIEIYNEHLNMISQERNMIQNQIDSNNELNKNLLEYKNELVKIQSEIY